MERKHLPSPEDQPRIPIPDCVKGRVYTIGCRNLRFGVFNGKDGFIGIRTKFRERFLFTEFHWDQGRPYGTVFRIAEYKEGLNVPEEVVVATDLGTEDASTNRLVEYCTAHKSWLFSDTKESSKNIVAVSISNGLLFEFLDEIEEANPNEQGFEAHKRRVSEAAKRSK